MLVTFELDETGETLYSSYNVKCLPIIDSEIGFEHMQRYIYKVLEIRHNFNLVGVQKVIIFLGVSCDLGEK